MVAEPARRVQVQLGVGEMLVERPAAGDVEDLEAAADAEQRQVPRQGGAGQRELEPIALDPGVRGVRVGLGSVARGIEIAAAGEQQAVEQVEHRLRVLGPRLACREDERQPPGFVDPA